MRLDIKLAYSISILFSSILALAASDSHTGFHKFTPSVQEEPDASLALTVERNRTRPHKPATTLSQQLTGVAPSHTLSTLIPETVLGVVNGSDGRRRVDTTRAWPYCLNGRLEMRFGNAWYRGSGALVGPRHVLTAAHNVCAHNVPAIPNGTWSQSVNFLPALNEMQIPFGMAEVVSAYVDPRWTAAGSKEHDIALLVLKEPVGQERGYSGLWAADENDLNRTTLVHITGYSGDTGREGHMLTMAHFLEYCAPEYLYYQIDTSSGQSGSSIVVNKETEDSTNPYIIGVHAYGDERQRRNFGIRLSRSKLDWLVDLINKTNGSFIAQASGQASAGTSLETSLESHFHLGNLEITPGNFEEIQRAAQSNPRVFETYEKGIYVKAWPSSKGGAALAALLKKFKNSKRLKIEISWEREKEEEEIIKAIGSAVGASSHLEELDLSNCRLTNQRLLGMLEGLHDSHKLKRLSIRENYFRAGIIELVKERLPNLKELDIETDEYPPLSEVTPWHGPSDLYQLYYKAFLGIREKYEELLGIQPDPLVLSYRMLLAYLTNGYSQVNEETLPKVISLARDLPMDQLREMAVRGDPEAQNNLGFALIIASGNHGNPELMKKAYRWFRKAASMSFIEAELGLSFCSEVRTDIEEAITHCKKAADNNHAGALLRLATTLYPRNVRMVVDIEHGAPMTDQGVQIMGAAFVAMRDAAIQGHVEAQFMFAECLERFEEGAHNVTVRRDRLEWYQRAATNGHVGARLKLEQLTAHQRATNAALQIEEID